MGGVKLPRGALEGGSVCGRDSTSNNHMDTLSGAKKRYLKWVRVSVLKRHLV